MQKSAALTFTGEVAELQACNMMLLLLDERTWPSGEDTAQLVAHVHRAIQKGVPILCVHEFPSVVGPARYACEFSRMVRVSDSQTNQNLVPCADVSAVLVSV